MDADSASSSSTQGSRSRYSPKRNHAAVCSSTSTNRGTITYERPTSSSHNERKANSRRYREEHEEKIPYFTDARREHDRVLNLRKRKSETPPPNTSHRRRRRRSCNRSPTRRVSSRERRLRYRARTRSRSRSTERYIRRRSRSHSRHTHTRVTPEPTTRTPVYIPVPVPVAGYPYGYPWPPMRHPVHSSFNPHYFTPAPFYVRLRAPPPGPAFYRRPYGHTTRFRHFRPPPHNYN